MPLTLTTLPTLLDALPERPGTHWELFTCMVYDLKARAAARDEETHR